MQNNATIATAFSSAAWVKAQDKPVVDAATAVNIQPDPGWISGIFETLDPFLVSGQFMFGGWAVTDMLSNVLLLASLVGILVAGYGQVLDLKDRKRIRLANTQLNKADVLNHHPGDPDTLKVGDSWYNSELNSQRVLVRCTEGRPTIVDLSPTDS